MVLDLHDYQANVEWDLVKMYVTTQEEKHKYNPDTTSRLISYHFILKRHCDIIRISFVAPTIGVYCIHTQMDVFLLHLHELSIKTSSTRFRDASIRFFVHSIGGNDFDVTVAGTEVLRTDGDCQSQLHLSLIIRTRTALGNAKERL